MVVGRQPCRFRVLAHRTCLPCLPVSVGFVHVCQAAFAAISTHHGPRLEKYLSYASLPWTLRPGLQFLLTTPLVPVSATVRNTAMSNQDVPPDKRGLIFEPLTPVDGRPVIRISDTRGPTLKFFITRSPDDRVQFLDATHPWPVIASVYCSAISGAYVDFPNHGSGLVATLLPRMQGHPKYDTFFHHHERPHLTSRLQRQGVHLWGYRISVGSNPRAAIM